MVFAVVGVPGGGSFARLQRLPFLDDLAARQRRVAGLPREDVRVTTHELVADRVDGVADREVAGLLADPGQEHRLEQEVAELFAEVFRLAASIASSTS